MSDAFLARYGLAREAALAPPPTLCVGRCSGCTCLPGARNVSYYPGLYEKSLAGEHCAWCPSRAEICPIDFEKTPSEHICLTARVALKMVDATLRANRKVFWSSEGLTPADEVGLLCGRKVHMFPDGSDWGMEGDTDLTWPDGFKDCGLLLFHYLRARAKDLVVVGMTDFHGEVTCSTAPAPGVIKLA